MLVLIKTLASIFLLESPMTDDVFMSTDFFQRLLKLFFGYHSNNMLHNLFKDCMVSAVRRLSEPIFQYVGSSDLDFHV